VKSIVEGYRLSPQQERLWPLLSAAGSDPYRAQCTVAIEGNLDPEGLAAALQEVIDRHEILRTSFHHLPGMTIPLQVVAERARARFLSLDLAAMSAGEQRLRIASLLDGWQGEVLDPERESPLDAALAALAPQLHVLMLSLPALCADRRGLENLVREVGAAYERIVAREGEAEPEPLQYSVVSEWLNELAGGDDAVAGREFWRAQRWGDAPIPTLPFEEVAAVGGFRPGSLELPLPSALGGEIERAARRSEVSMATFLLGVWAALLGRLTGRSSLVVGVGSEGRTAEEVTGSLGLFSRDLPLACRLEPGEPFGSLLGRLELATAEAYAWQDCFNWDLMASAGGEPRWLPFGFEFGTAAEPFLAGGLRFSWREHHACTARFKLRFAALRRDSALSAQIAFATELFRSEEIHRLAGRYLALLEGALELPGAPLGDLPVLSREERRQLLVDRNQTTREYPQLGCLHELFARQVARTPAAVAVTLEEQALTYEELDYRARGLAARLVELGVGPDERVGVLADRSLEMVVALLAVHKAGGAYLPLDPAYPGERLAAMLADAGPRLVLVQPERLADLPPAWGGPVVALEPAATAAAAAPDVDGGAGLDNLAYVIYTSGSTGSPKGVMISHRAIFNRLAWMQSELPLSAADRVLQKTPFSFDASVWELFSPLLAGARLVLARPGGHQDTAYLVTEIARREVTILQLVPSMLRVFLEQPGSERLPSLRRLYSGGEALPIDLVASLSGRLGTEMHNLYGPTEAAIDATHWPCRLRDASPLAPLGQPIGNARVYLLDGRGQPVPMGVPGELHIGGRGLARGYLGRPDLTAERFVPDPFATMPGTRLYRTGDLCRYARDGELEYLGRLDYQIKIRGFRIEPGEIEAPLRRHSGLREAVVVAWESEPGDRRLVAYVVPAGESEPSPGELRSWLAERLPEHMIPSSFMTLEALPLTVSGKVDRNRLPAPGGQNGLLADSYIAPRTPLEEVLAGVWAELLGLDRVGVETSFFELGGHSLLATQLVSRVREIFGMEVSLRRLFESPTVSELAKRVEEGILSGARAEVPPIRPVPRDRDLPLSFAQQRLWFLDQLEPGNAAYNIAVAVRLRGPLQASLLELALSEIVSRHEALRTVFTAVDGEPLQRVLPPGRFPLPIVDLQALPAARGMGLLSRLAREEGLRAFDLSHGPLLRVSLLRLGEEDHVILLSMHHIVGDGWSMGLLVRELTTLYRALAAGEPPPLPELRVQYADFAHWQRDWLRGRVLEEHLAYWRDQLGRGDPVLELPTDRPRPPVQGYRGTVRSRLLAPDLAQELRMLGRRRSATLFMTLLAAFQTLLHRYTGQRSISVGTPIAGRNQAEIEPLIGFFANTLLLRTDLGGNPTFEALLARVRDAALGAYAHQDLPFEVLVEELQPERSLSYSPLFQVMLSFQNRAPSASEPLGLSLQAVDFDLGVVKFDLELAAVERAEGVLLSLEFNTTLFEPATGTRILEALLLVLRGAAGNPGMPIWDLPLLDPGQRQQLLRDWNDAEVAFPEEAACLHELIERQATRSPGAVAVMFEGESLTYAELDRRANRRACALRGLGAGPETLVGVCLERSLEMVVSLLAVLKAGGAYVPIDPAYPRERLAHMLADSGVPLLLTTKRLALELPLPETGGPAVLYLDAPDEPEVAGPPQPGAWPGSAAYAIYTSGSTGRPKCVVNSHRGIVNRLLWMQRAYGLGSADRVLQKTPFSFDVSVWEFFWPLLAGARLVMARPEGHQDPAYLADLIAEAGITTVHFVPSMLQVFLEESGAALCTSLRRVIVSGEALPAELRDRFFQRLPGGVELHNLYGPTEAAVDVTFEPCLPGRGEAGVAIGRPVANTRIHLLDREMRPVPVGVGGELHIGGVQLARGYLGRPELTAERFVPDPCGEEPGGRLYKTGDLARHLPDGRIEFLGRLDHQVKVRGFRIELGEIEACLNRQPEVRESVVVAQGEGADRRLVAYVVPTRGEEPTASRLREALRDALPEPMVPAVFVILPAFPLSPSGKVDRRALSTPSAELPAPNREPVAPRTPLERQLKEIWETVLGVRPIGVTDDFFDLGGHSLLAVRLLARIQKAFKKTIPLATLFQAGTVERLAGALRASGTVKLSPLVCIQTGRADRLPLFLAHPIGGTVLGYKYVARHLGPERPVYGLQDPYLEVEGGEAVRLTLAEMAAEYVSAIRELRPCGPYLLGGWSFGGILAFEMARQIRELHEEVPLLAIFDSAPRGQAAEETDEEMLVGIARDMARQAGHELPLADLEAVEPGARRMAYILRQMREANLLADELRDEVVHRYLKRRRANQAAASSYQPSLYPGHLVLFRAIDPDPLAGPGEAPAAADPALGWSEFSPYPVEVLEMPGYHAALLFEPFVGAVAEQLRPLIAEAEKLHQEGN
jgi:amino acid adenylation domain-containing protein